MLDFPAVGASHRVPVFEEPLQGADENDATYALRMKGWRSRAGVVAHVRLQRPEVRVEWLRAFARELAAEDARQRAALEAHDPLAGALSPEGEANFRALQRGVVEAGLAALEGVRVGGIDLGVPGLDPKVLTDAVEGTGWLGPVAAAVRRGQSPTPTQLEP